MPVNANTKQGEHRNLEDFYSERSQANDPVEASIGQGMLRVLQFLNESFKHTLIWGLTSHYRLVLQTADDWKKDWYVIIGTYGGQSYAIEYLLPEAKRPWEHAYVKGETFTWEGTKKYILIAMKECGGWDGNKELEELL